MGIPEDAFCYTALLKAAARERNASRTESLFEKAWDSGIREAPIFNVLISQHNALGQIKVINNHSSDSGCHYDAVSFPRLQHRESI